MATVEGKIVSVRPPRMNEYSNREEYSVQIVDDTAGVLNLQVPVNGLEPKRGQRFNGALTQIFAGMSKDKQRAFVSLPIADGWGVMDGLYEFKAAS